MLDNNSLSPLPVPVPLAPARREQQIAGGFMAAADTLGDDFDVPAYLGDLGSCCAALARADAAVVTLAYGDDDLHTAVSWPPGLAVLGLFTDPALPGPHRWCFASAAQVFQPDLASPDARWQRFAVLVTEAGFRSVFCVPLRRQGSTLGVISLLRTRAGGIPKQDLRICSALGEAAAAGLLHRRVIHEHQQAAAQLRVTLSLLSDLDAPSHARAAVQAIRAGLPKRSRLPAGLSGISPVLWGTGHSDSRPVWLDKPPAPAGQLPAHMHNQVLVPLPQGIFCSADGVVHDRALPVPPQVLFRAAGVFTGLAAVAAGPHHSS